MITSSIGAAISLLLGCIAVIAPQRIESFVSLNANNVEGLSEIRATYGGFFIGISIYALFSQSKDAFLVMGTGWLAAAFVRAITLCCGSYSHKNLGGVLFEALVGILCVWSVNPYL